MGYEEELRRLRNEVNELTNAKDRAELQRDNLAEDAAKWRDKYDDEHRLRKELEQEVAALRKDCDDATLVRTDLERRLETTVEEIEFLRRCHEEEIRELREQLAQQESIKIEAAPGADGRPTSSVPGVDECQDCTRSRDCHLQKVVGG